MRFWVAALFITGTLSVSGQEIAVPRGIETDTVKMMLSDLQVNLVKYFAKKSDINFLVIHDSEDTGVEAALEYIDRHGGSLIDSQYGNVRNFKFCCEDTFHEADPNAIYTRPGIFTGLNKYSTWKASAATHLEKMGKEILRFYDPIKNGYIVTLHNNLDSGFSITSYLPGNYLESTATEVYVNPDMDEDDLVLVTRQEHFNYLKAENVNVILQSPEAPNDGSLSVYAMYMDIPYVNVEVQHGRKDEQFRLIKIVAEMLKQDRRNSEREVAVRD